MSNLNTASINALEWKSLAGDDGKRASDNEKKVRRGFWKKLQRSATHVPFAQDAIAAYYAAFDKSTPLKVRAALLGTLAYFIMPVDAIPDVLPIVGYSDDAALLLGTLRMLTDHINPLHHSAAQDALEGLRRADL
ncbi:YkvA family protein [Xanthobacter sp. TB0136]|uniref:YkvA family protein n=1 Tax=Xanthobacter sp. TB0136 TaxID=3459177 RepID=UPI004039A8FC